MKTTRSKKVSGASRSGLSLTLLIAALVASSQAAKPDYPEYQAPEMFSYAELVTLSNTDPLDDVMTGKLKLLTTTPFVSNEAYYAAAKPHNPSLHGTPSLRVVFWNIERGLRLEEIKLAFTDKRAFLAKMEESANKLKAAPDGEGKEEKSASRVDIEKVKEQLNLLQSADVVVLNEVDWGVKRTGYRSVIKELGGALKMNWAYGVEFVEVDPLILGTEQFQEVENPDDRAKVAANPEAGLFDSLEEFRFDDETALDFRGIKSRTINGTSGTLANSNQRAGKGFVPTFQFERTIGAKGKFKLDWIFVKSYLHEPRNEYGPYLFAPHVPRTMFDVNYAFPERISDHTPISVDLPLAEPRL